jgi:hypothetical protein
MYQVHALCYSKYFHRLLTKIKFYSKIEVIIPSMFSIVLERNSRIDVVTDRILLYVCILRMKFKEASKMRCLFWDRRKYRFYIIIYTKIISFYRDVRGFAIKLYSDDGIWDLLGLHTPTFFIRDPILLPFLVHSTKRNPVTNIKVRIIFELQLWNIRSLKQTFTFTARPLLLFSVHSVQNDDYYYKRTLSHQTIPASKHRRNLYQCDITTNCVFIFQCHSNK